MKVRLDIDLKTKKQMYRKPALSSKIQQYLDQKETIKFKTWVYLIQISKIQRVYSENEVPAAETGIAKPMHEHSSSQASEILRFPLSNFPIGNRIDN